MNTTRLVCGHCKVDVQEFAEGREGAVRCPHCGRAVDRRTVQQMARTQRQQVGWTIRGSTPIGLDPRQALADDIQRALADGRETVVEF